MANKQKILIITLFILSSCQRLYYPGTSNIALITKKYQAKISTNIGSNGFLFQTAFSPLQNFSTQGNVIYLSRTKDNFTYGTKYGEIAIGYYNKFSGYDWEVYTGYGSGVNLYGQDSIKIRKWYIQPDIGWQSKYFSIGISPKLSLLKYVHTGSSYLMPAFEPSLLFSLGYEHIFINTQAGVSIIPVHTLTDMKSSYFSLSLGFTFKF